jgi:hypothetical protein
MPCLQLPITRMPTKQSLVDTTRFALFIGTLSGGYNVLEAMFSALRNNRPNDTIPAIVAGGVVGTALLIDSESRRQPIALYTCANALHLVFVSMIKKGLVPDILPGGIPSYYVLLTCLCACWTLFACGFYPTSFFDSYKYFLIDFGKVPWVCATRPHTHTERERERDVVNQYQSLIKPMVEQTRALSRHVQGTTTTHCSRSSSKRCQGRRVSRLLPHHPSTSNVLDVLLSRVVARLQEGHEVLPSDPFRWHVAWWWLQTSRRKVR